ncbi:MAG: DUF547 domain-containing protein, partial [Verrucomicrobiales bacterium]|nr:DUF547 domain-containing protein [Verrucomicrobiales bacterium]
MRPRYTLTIAILVLLLGAGWWWASSTERPESGLIQFEAPRAFAGARVFSFDAFGETLRRYVNDRGLVDYRGLKADSGELDAFAASLAQISPAEFDAWSERRKIAFWINAYNALTLEAILRNYPIRSSFLRSTIYPKNSIRQIPGVWDKLRFGVAGREMTLDEIEHGAL